MDAPMRFGIFLAPFHPVGQNPTLALERDLELVVRLDQLGYDEAWIGEHHSAAFELVASPEVFIAAAAERTKHIRLGTGVSSLPYHHPFMLADRINQLDHMTRAWCWASGNERSSTGWRFSGRNPAARSSVLANSLSTATSRLSRVQAKGSDREAELVRSRRLTTTE